jgi:hypothetical protein
MKDAKMLCNSSPSFLAIHLLLNQCCVLAWSNVNFHCNEALRLRLIVGFSSATLVCGSDESQTC